MWKKKKNGFPGGIHPTDGYDKALTMESTVRTYRPETVVILAEQSPGGTCEFLVKPGDRVKEGSLIGKPAAFMAAPLHASVSGTVMEQTQVQVQGKSVSACVIRREAEQEREPESYEKSLIQISDLSREEILTGIREGGLTGMGGAGFPTFRKYETENPIEVLLINGAECEPFLTCDYRLMIEKGEAVVNGTRLLLKASGAKKALICIEDNKPEAVNHLRNILDKGEKEGILDPEEKVEVFSLQTRYPQGGERQLIESALGKEVPMGGLPADIGVIVSNVGTAKAAADMLLGGHPLTSRIVTVTGCVKEPGNYLVPVGTSAKELIGLCGGVTAKKNRIIAGGPMTGICMASDWNGERELFYITRSTSGILVLPESRYEEQPCIRCAGCSNVCPAGLIPCQIEFAWLEEDYDLCEKLYASECIACGCCSYICPARRELAQRVRMARDLVKQRRREREVKKS